MGVDKLELVEIKGDFIFLNLGEWRSSFHISDFTNNVEEFVKDLKRMSGESEEECWRIVNIVREEKSNE